MKPMLPAEIGQVQFQYFDKQGVRLNIRRNYDGDFVKGANEMMANGQNNTDGNIYMGPNNPTYKDNNGFLQPDYRREPMNEEDQNSEHHDKGYDKQNAKGATDAFFNKKVVPADISLINSSSITYQKLETGGLDNVTGKPVTPATAHSALKAQLFFTLVLFSPFMKNADVKINPSGNVELIKHSSVTPIKPTYTDNTRVVIPPHH